MAELVKTTWNPFVLVRRVPAFQRLTDSKWKKWNDNHQDQNGVQILQGKQSLVELLAHKLVIDVSKCLNAGLDLDKCGLEQQATVSNDVWQIFHEIDNLHNIKTWVMWKIINIRILKYYHGIHPWILFQ